MSHLCVEIERIPFGVVSENGYKTQVDKFQLTGTLTREAAESSGCELRPSQCGQKPALVATVCPLGACMTSLLVPDRHGQLADITLGFDTLKEYEQQDSYIGATIGRNASRIAGSAFELDGRKYSLAQNSAGSHLHGGLRGFDKRLWAVETGEDSVTFSYISRHGEEGYPGDVMVQVTYRLILHGGFPSLSLQYRGLAGSATPLNMTNHSYFNLAGHDSGEAGLREHQLSIRADKKLVLDGGFANGEFTSLGSSGGELRGSLPEVMTASGGEIDDVFVLPPEREATLTPAATLSHPASGRRLTVLTNQAALVVYTANHLPAAPGGLPGKAGARYQRHGSIALETSGFPNAMNVPSFPQVTLQPGHVYDHRCIYQLGA